MKICDNQTPFKSIASVYLTLFVFVSSIDMQPPKPFNYLCLDLSRCVGRFEIHDLCTTLGDNSNIIANCEKYEVCLQFTLNWSNPIVEPIV